MIEKLKQPLVLIGLAVLLIVMLVSWYGQSRETAEVDPAQLPVSDLNTANKPSGNTGVSNDTGKTNASSTVTKNSGSTATKDKMPRHQDMLSEEMKQAIRDDLILHGPGKTFEKPDGTVVLPSGGRSTQVSVAVQMPDGTIQIREYSELPKDTKPKYTVSPQPNN